MLGGDGHNNWLDTEDYCMATFLVLALAIPWNAATYVYT